MSWSACRDGFQCGTLSAPLDHDRPHGPAIGISVIRLPAGVPAQRIGSLMINPGGPGGSGVDVVRDVARLLPLELRARFDIVGFDPRGILRSTPLRCFDTFDQALDVLPPFPFPVTTAEENVQRAADDRLAAACARRGSPILAHMSTADAARDMDLLRRALGDPKLTYLGFSYGSMLGQTYANLFPGRVRALVVDGVLDPIAWTTGRGAEARTVPFSTRLRSDQGAQATLGEFFRLCDAARADCAFAGRADRRYAALAQRLRRQPVTVTDPETGETFRFTYQDLIGISLGALYGPGSWPDFAMFLRDLERQASATVVGRRLATVRAGLGLAAAPPEPYPNVVEGFPGVACSDSVNPRSFHAYQRAADTAERRYGYFGRLWTWASGICRPWPRGAGQDRHLGPWTARTSSPVLIVGNHYDPATRYQGAVVASRLLPNSRLLTYAGWGHTAFFSAGNFCVDQHVTTYLVTTRLPARGTVCRPAGSPFGPLEATARRQATTAAAAVLTGSALPAPVRRAVRAR
ncbi:hydrolase [Spirilliplanes yamanashiensis]|uniref:Hydrolase n=1 Tax=Spirilliplanes yamanashiensis TaxID=42233 RepID=A0A8J4DKK2_9ACTN|nr:hydrolase [Spirilliplanes yamanashiensis]